MAKDDQVTDKFPEKNTSKRGEIVKERGGLIRRHKPINDRGKGGVPRVRDSLNKILACWGPSGCFSHWKWLEKNNTLGKSEKIEERREAGQDHPPKRFLRGKINWLRGPKQSDKRPRESFH